MVKSFFFSVISSYIFIILNLNHYFEKISIDIFLNVNFVYEL